MTSEQTPMSRRAFLGGTAGAALAVGALRTGRGSSQARTTTVGVRDRPDPGAAQRVVVVGAGLAGLTAALDLRAAGWDVVVVEARQRVGGRVHTLYGGGGGVTFVGGVDAEGGGEGRG